MHHGFELPGSFVKVKLRTGLKLLGISIILALLLPMSNILANDSIPPGGKTPAPHNHDDIKKGERLFFGLINLGKDTKTCVSCHNTSKLDTLSWNPSAFEIGVASQGKSEADLKNVLLNPVGIRLSNVHKGYVLTDEQIGQIHSYIISLPEKGAPQHKKLMVNRLIFIGLILLVLLVIADVIYTRYLRFKAINLLVVLIAGFFLTKITVTEAMAVGRSQNYEPDQPIKFSHAVHAKQNKIDCLYCHSSAEYSKAAGIPPANVCLNCHTLVREGARSGRFEINKIHAAVDMQKPIEWIKIHNLPDHVYFNHAQHVSVGKVTCQECHGPVENMDRVKQVSDLSMGWCIDCHRTKEVQFMDNAFYDKYEKLHKDLKDGKIDKVTAEKVGATDCMKCHY